MTDLLKSLVSGDPDAFQSTEQRRQELARDLVASSYIRGSYVMSSGAASDYYIDPTLFMTKPTVLRRLASLLADMIPFEVDRLAGSEPGSVAIVAAVSIETGLPFVALRGDPHNRAAGQHIAGEVHSGERVMFIEDVITSGSHSLASMAVLAAKGIEVAGVLAAINREEGGDSALARSGYSLDALFRISELVEIGASRSTESGEQK
jgi:orotate phosphoribosyltransferase